MTKVSTESRRASESGSDKSEVIMRIVGGPAAGREIPLKSNKITVGRAISADISIPDTVISRTHIVLVRDGMNWRIQDLGSTNGTWVRGEKIKGEAELPLKTPVRIGNTLFELYRPTVVAQPTALDESLISYRVSPITAESLTLHGEVTAFQVQREQQKLAAIYKVQSLLTTDCDETELYHKILEVIFEVVPADSSYMLLYIPEEDNMIPVVGRNQRGRVDVITENYISRSIVDYVKQKNEAILSVDATNDERFHSMSLCGFNVHSVMCVPMLGRQHICGSIYLSSMKSTRDYKEEDLRLLTIIAHAAGMAVENKRLIEDNIKAERMAAIGITAAGLSHYVKNILNGLEGSVSLLRLGIDNSDKQLMDEAWSILNKNHKRLSTLVLDLLNLAKEDAVELTMYNVANLLVEIVELIEAQTADKHIEIVMDENLRGSEMYAEIDSRGIHRVMLNILSNAVDSIQEKFPDSGGRIEINLCLEEQGQMMVVTVRDNGIGIAKERTEEIFEMFHTGKGDRGTGLGLAVSKRIIENHKGRLTVDSVEGEYALFTVKLPTRHRESRTGFIPKAE